VSEATARGPVWLAALAALATAACAFEARSPAYVCADTDECSDGRVCEGGWCVRPTGLDGAVAPHDGADANGGGCDPACTMCRGTTCVIQCDAPGSCAAQIVCPAGQPCEVVCDGASSCAGGVDCTAATSCNLTCSGDGSCGALACGTGPCDVECSGASSCDSGIVCTESCACRTDCSGLGACSTAPTCPGPGTCTAGNGNCRIGPAPCNNC
jgi:hypothetical protein